LQKLGIPTEIATRKKAYYLTPIDDMAQGDSFHIMPGVNKNDYGAAHAIACKCSRDEDGAVRIACS
jgi:hypothetical protein